MAALSAGILLHRVGDAGLEVLIVHPGGPFWARRDLGAWSIPKGEIEPGEDPLAAARREFREELGSDPPDGKPVSLGEVRQRSGKRILAWSLEGDLDPAGVVSNTVEVTVRGRRVVVPEVDRAEWFAPATAREKLNPGQVPLLDRLEALLGRREPAS
ncbi:MAG TPA: NUDIX domain-containing protein [Solirubrobacteraceae bacterium]|nr:NUDIX domain-containing protein [Solirubrobacteraceae bacterium]